MKALLLFVLLLARPSSGAGGKFVSDWSAARAREFEAAVNPFALAQLRPHRLEQEAEVPKDGEVAEDRVPALREVVERHRGQ